MNTRLASVATALVLTLGASLSPALAQSYNAPAGISAAAAPGGLEGRAAAYNAREAARGGYAVDQDADDLVTGSIGRRGGDRSAKGGNAEQTNKLVPNYGSTSGGPAY